MFCTRPFDDFCNKSWAGAGGPLAARSSSRRIWKPRFGRLACPNGYYDPCRRGRAFTRGWRDSASIHGPCPLGPKSGWSPSRKRFRRSGPPASFAAVHRLLSNARNSGSICDGPAVARNPANSPSPSTAITWPGGPLPFQTTEVWRAVRIRRYPRRLSASSSSWSNPPAPSRWRPLLEGRIDVKGQTVRLRVTDGRQCWMPGLFAGMIA